MRGAGLPEVIGIYDFQPPAGCTGIEAMPLADSPFDYSWKLERQLTKWRDQATSTIGHELRRLAGWI